MAEWPSCMLDRNRFVAKPLLHRRRDGHTCARLGCLNTSHCLMPTHKLGLAA